jgi:RNA polymerase sigma-70 factor (ECF subfamily)
MAIRATPDNLSLDFPSDAAVPAGRIAEFAEVWAHRESLRQACTRLIGDPARAEDLVQETFLSAIRSGPRLEPRESMGPWLATVARRRSIDELRGRRRLAVVPTPPEPEPTVLDDPAEQFLSQELITQLRAAIAELTPRERQLLLRQATYGLSLSDLAAEEETSVASVRSVLTRARQKVRMSLERGGALGGLPVPRWLLNLRDKVARSAYLWEPALPTLTGAGAQAVVAIAAAVAMLIGGVGATHTPDHSLTMIGADSDSDPVSPLRGAGEGGGHAPSAPEVRTAIGSGEPPGTSRQGDALITPAALPLPTRAPLDSRTPDDTSPFSFARSETGGHVYALANISNAGTALFRSTDSGATWQRLHTLDYKLDGQVLVPPSYPASSTIFIATATHLLRSDDAGLTFLPVAPTRGNRSVLVPPDFSTTGRLILAGAPFMAYHVQDRSLETLGAAIPAVSTTLSVIPGGTYGTDRAMLIGTTMPGGTKGLYTSAVYRCTTTTCGAPVPLPFGGSTPELVRLSSGVVITFMDTPPFATHRSTDDGASFQRVALPANLQPEAFIEGLSGELIMAGAPLGVGLPGLFRSTDLGASWAVLGTGTDMAGGSRAMIRLTTGAILATATPAGSGVRCSHDDGITWSRRC